MRKWAVFLVCLVLVAGAGFWFWLLGSLPAAATPQMTLRIDQGTVFRRFPSNPSGAPGPWEPGKNGDQLFESQDLRTDAGSSAAIVYDGKSETRLGPATELHIERAEREAGKPFVVSLQLVSGRVWSRVLRLLDLDESFVVRTNTVVATVRGTAFDLEASVTGTTLWVSDAAVEVTSGETGLAVTEGSMAKFDPHGKLLSTSEFTDEARQSDWFIKNTTADTAFIRTATENVAARFSGLNAPSPESLVDKFAKYSERIHLSLATAQAPDLFARYVTRRLYAIKRLIEDGNSGLAFQSLSSVDEDISLHLSGPNAERFRYSLKRALGDMLFFMKDVGSSSPVYRMKQRLEDLNVKLAGADEIETAYAHLLSIEARLDEASSLIIVSSLDDAKNALDAARQGLQNVEQDIARLSKSEPARLRALTGKMNTLKMREAGMRVRLATAVAPPTGQLLHLESIEATSSTVPVATSTGAVSSTVAASGFVRLELVAQPNPALVGTKVSLSVRGVFPDETRQDITAKSQFKLLGGLGSLNGPLYLASTAGSVTLQAIYQDANSTLTASLPLEIKAPPITLTSIAIQPQGSSVLTFLSRVSLHVTAFYSDGSSKDVTQLAQITSANPTIGSMVGNMFVAGKIAGSTLVTASYADMTGTSPFQVIGP